MKKTYRGACHCGDVRFEIDADIDHVRSCNCSVCSKRGALFFRVPAADFRLLSPLAQLSVYRWGTMTGADYFCPRCGVLPFRRPSHPSKEERALGLKPFDGWAVNTRCLQDFDVSSVPVKPIDGLSLKLA